MATTRKQRKVSVLRLARDALFDILAATLKKRIGQQPYAHNVFELHNPFDRCEPQCSLEIIYGISYSRSDWLFKCSLRMHPGACEEQLLNILLFPIATSWIVHRAWRDEATKGVHIVTKLVFGGLIRNSSKLEKLSFCYDLNCCTQSKHGR